jgi:hypothetical protein
MEELMKLTQDDLQREQYESRLKARLDYNTDIREATENGIDRGELIGTIRLCEKLLKQAPTPTQRLRALPLDELNRLAEQLQKQIPLPQ